MPRDIVIRTSRLTMRDEEEIALDQQQFLDRYDEAAAMLRRVPGVLSVGVGARERGGELLPELAFRVYVAAKIAESELPPSDHVPRVVCGLPTDVIVNSEVDELARDTTKYRPLIGGCQTRTEKWEGDNTRGMGTLGCLAKLADGTIVALTAQHVACAGTPHAVGVGTPTPFGCVGVKVGQPRHVTCCCCCTFNEIGEVLRAEKTAEIDCAIVKLDSDTADGVKSGGTIGKVAEIGALTGVAAAVATTEVRKRGAATGLTRGTVIDVAYEGNQILIRPLPAFPKFADFGDSGAVVVDAAGKVVGLLWGADRSTKAQGVANHIAPVVAAMGITIGGNVVLGPENVPGLSEYDYKIDVRVGSVATAITWTVDKPSATIVGAANAVTVRIRFTNAAADLITLRAAFTLNGNPASAVKEIALVQVTVGPRTFTNPGLPNGSAAGTKVFLGDPPPLPAVPTYKTTNSPGSVCAAFTSNITDEADEPRRLVSSNGAGGGSAFHAETTVTLTSPAARPTAHQRIRIGFIQHGSDAGGATYTPGGARTVTTQTSNTVDWLSSPCNPAPTDTWPWYDETARLTGAGPSPWTDTVAMDDSPSLSIPAQHDPNHPGPGSANALNTAAETFSFAIEIGVQTLDAEMSADQHFFDVSHSTWTVNFAWPVVPGVSIITLGGAWIVSAVPTEISVNVIPTSTNHNAPFLQWVAS